MSQPRDYVLYLDMDGCMTNFDKAASALKDGYDAINLAWQHGNVHGADYKEWKADLLVRIKATDKFWLNLEWMPDGKRYIDQIQKTYDHNNIAILTAPMHDDRCKPDKLEWIKRELPFINEDHFICADDKENYINFLPAPKQILIDDRIANINAWQAKGAIGVFHTTTDDTIEQLKEILGF